MGLSLDRETCLSLGGSFLAWPLFTFMVPYQCIYVTTLNVATIVGWINRTSGHNEKQSGGDTQS